MDSFKRDRNEMIKAILSAVDGGNLTYSELNRRLKRAIDAEMDKPDDRTNYELVSAYEDLLNTLNSNREAENSYAHIDGARQLVRRLEIQSRKHAIRRFSAAACLAAGLMILSIISDGVLRQQWISGEQSEDEQQYVVSGHEIDPGLTSDASASENEMLFSTESFEALVQATGFTPQLPSWLPEGWTVREYNFSRTDAYEQTSVFYEHQDTEYNLSYIITEYHDKNMTRSDVEQNYRGETVNVDGWNIYVSQNTDQTICIWSEKLTLYTLFGPVDKQQLFRMIESIRE